MFISKIPAYISISRPLNFLITFFSVIVASVICMEKDYSVLKIFYAALSAGFTASAGNIINDYFDLNIDKINKPGRVLPGGKLSLKEALAFYLILSVAALLISVQINLVVFLEVFFAALLLFLYSYKFKKIPLLGNFIIAFLTGFVFLYGGMAVNNPASAAIPALFAFLINMIREIIKDMEDVEGDKIQGVNTFPVLYGLNKSKNIVVIVTFVLIILTVYPFVINHYDIEYFLIIMIFVNPLLIYILKSLFENDSVKNLGRLSNLLKLNMVMGLIAIYIGQ